MADVHRTIDVFGASVTGPSHLAEGKLCEDAWGHGWLGDSRVVVASDGMGSRPLSRLGAKAACGAVIDAVRQWCRHSQAPVDVLLGLIHLLWRARVAPHDAHECACTCLFALMAPDGSGLVAQLGDGLVLIGSDDGVEPLQTRDEDHFGNETAALGCTRKLSAWVSRPLAPQHRSVVLCTDGVAEDLLPDRFGDFVAWLDEEIRPRRPTHRWRVLASELRNWPTPKHIDDKTIAMIHAHGESDDR